MTEPFAAAEAAAATLAAATGVGSHDVAIVLGSGWAAAADALGPATAEVAFSELGGFPEPSVAGHVGSVRSLRLGSHRVLAFLGRVHGYEGHPPATVVHGVRTAVAAGCRTVILTNAAGALRADLTVGSAVLISDQLNLTGSSPLSGAPPPPGLGSRFTDLTDLYSVELRALAREADPTLREGVYAGLPGPHYETPAEVAMLARLGADLVGMSTVLEAIAARHLGARVTGLSLVTNPAAGLGAGAIEHAEVLAAGVGASGGLGELLERIVRRLP